MVGLGFDGVSNMSRVMFLEVSPKRHAKFLKQKEMTTTRWTTQESSRKGFTAELPNIIKTLNELTKECDDKVSSEAKSFLRQCWILWALYFENNSPSHKSSLITRSVSHY